MKKCPRCRKIRIKDEVAQNSCSRRDNKTYICSQCGREEALLDYASHQDVNTENVDDFSILIDREKTFKLKLAGGNTEESHEIDCLNAVMLAFIINPKETLTILKANAVYLPDENSIDMCGDSLSEWHPKELDELQYEMEQVKESL